MWQITKKKVKMGRIENADVAAAGNLRTNLFLKENTVQEWTVACN